LLWRPSALAANSISREPKPFIREAAAMASSISSTYTLQKALLLITYLLGVVAADVGGGQDNLHYCPPFSCGHLHNISYPFRLQGDTRDCGIGPRPWYDLSCNNGKATILINTRTYYVSSINYTDLSFLAIDATVQDDSNSSSCPLPGADLHPPNIDWPRPRWEISNDSFVDLDTDSGSIWACFVNCSKPIIADANMPRYRPLACLPANNSFFYLNRFHSCAVGELQPSYRYLGMIPFEFDGQDYSQLENASYTDLVGFIRKGFRVRFPFEIIRDQGGISTTQCLNDSMR
jgi:hypothetical protein